MDSKLSYTILFIWFFFMTLHSFYFYELGLALFSTLSALLTIPLIVFYKIKIKDYHRLPLQILFFIFIFSLITSLPNTEYFYIQRIPLMVLIVPCIIFSGYLINEKPELLLKIVKVSLFVHILFFFFQFSFFYISGHFIDYLQPITGESQRAFGGNYEISNSGSQLIRATGLFNEPGTYSTFVFLMLAVKKELEAKFNSIDKLLLFDIIILISVLLTFSVFGFIFSAIFIFKYFIREELNKKILMIIFSTPFIYLVFDRYLSVRFQKDSSTSGIGLREDAIDFYISKVLEAPFHLLFGYSNFIDLNSLFKVELSWNDVSFLFTIFVTMGVFGGGMFFLITIKRIKRSYFAILILCLCKLSITTFFIWFSLVYIYRPLKVNARNNG